jgi:SAM-dependent methyltransferase
VSEKPVSFNGIWEDIYHEGRQLNRYPFDQIVSFVYRNYPREKPRSEVRLLEVGCGAGNNLWFAAREGFQVAGIDGSASAIDYARKRFAEDGLQGDLRVGDFTSLPWDDRSFDLAFDRGALTNCGLSMGRKAVAEVRRVLVPGGKFYFNPYSVMHSSHVAGSPGPDGVTQEIRGGGLEGMGSICFYTRRDVENALGGGWHIRSLVHVERTDVVHPQYTVSAEWRVYCERAG